MKSKFCLLSLSNISKIAIFAGKMKFFLFSLQKLLKREAFPVSPSAWSTVFLPAAPKTRSTEKRSDSKSDRFFHHAAPTARNFSNL